MWNVGAKRQHDTKVVGMFRFAVELLQPLPYLSGCYPDDRVCIGIVGRTPSKDQYADTAFLDVYSVALHRSLHNIAKERGKASAVHK
jgi:hypothetical protein